MPVAFIIQKIYIVLPEILINTGLFKNVLFKFKLLVLYKSGIEVMLDL